MPSDCQFSYDVIDAMRRHPIHTVLQDLGTAAVELNVHRTDEFKKLVAYILELADGRDRREPWTQKPGVARPIPKLRITVDAAFRDFAELQWFKLNRTANHAGAPLYGLFPRMSAAVARVDPKDFGAIITALVSASPDAALLRLLHTHGGKIKGMGLELFSSLAFAFRRDLYFVLPKEWAERTGCLKYIGSDLRKYCALCRGLRSVCDGIEITPAIRGSVLRKALEQDPIDETLTQALHKSLGPALIKHTLLDPGDAYEPKSIEDDHAAMPLEFATCAIRARRGEKRLRNHLRQSYGDRCAISGPCPRELLEVAYIVPFPQGNVHSLANAVLLRSDLHTLWDLNLIGIDPEDLKVQVSERLKKTIYAEFHGRGIVAPQDGTVVSSASLRERWKTFRGDRDNAPRTAKSAPIAAKPVKKKSNGVSESRPTPARRHADDGFPERTPSDLSPADSHHGTKVT